MCDKLEYSKSIQKSKLNKYHYTLSLLKEGVRVKLIDQSTASYIQQHIMIILKELVLRYTNGESSSVKVETAESLLNSLLYAVDAKLNQFENPEESLAYLKNTKITDLYNQGIQLIQTCFFEAKTKYLEIRCKKLKIPLEMYHTSINDALPGFFRDYNIIFNAHDTMCTLDYPLVFDDMNVQGIFYIKNYLETLNIENSFCQLFKIEDIKNLLKCYGRVYKISYSTSPINVFEIVIIQAIFAELVGKKPEEILLSDDQLKMLNRSLNKISLLEINSLVTLAFAKMVSDLQITQPGLINYILRYQSPFMARLMNAIQNNCLHKIFITQDSDTTRDQIVFFPMPKMSNESFRNLFSQILECVNPIDKIKIITMSNLPFEDFLDLLEADCLFGDEYHMVFETLSNLELAMLGSIIFQEEMRNDQFELLSSLEDTDSKEIDWQQQFILYLKQLDPEKIYTLANSMKIITT